MSRVLGVFVFLLLALGSVRPAHADATVNLCKVDIQPGPGTNLSQAIAIGGRITFACGGVATIKVNCIHHLQTDTEIDGGGVITLAGPNAKPFVCGVGFGLDYSMFDALLSSRTLALKLSGVKIVDARPTLPGGGASAPSASFAGGVARGNLSLTLSGVTITNSAAPISVISGAVHVERSVFSGNSGTVIEAHDIDIRDHSLFSNNKNSPLGARGGSISIADSDFTGNGAADLLNCTAVNIARVHFTGNMGGALQVNCDTTIANSAFTNNQGDLGGALFVADHAGHVLLQDVTFTGNAAVNAGGAIFAGFTSIFGTPSTATRSITLRGVKFQSNRARQGGAVTFEWSPASPSNWTLTGAAVEFLDNQATEFGGAMQIIHNNVRLSRSIFSGNRAGQSGGAIAATQTGDATVELANSLLVQNGAPSGAAFGGDGATLINTTIADNDGPAISPYTKQPSWTPSVAALPVQPIRFRNTIVAGGTGPACGAGDAKAPYRDLGNNLQYSGHSCSATIGSAYPLFGPSYIPLPLSPALNNGDDAVCAAAPIDGKDIWGKQRPNGAHCAIGAAEGDVANVIQQLVEQAGRVGSALARCYGSCGH